jgi:hypothetical protein
VNNLSNLFLSNTIAGVTIFAALVAPQSLGMVKISSSNASIPPLINLGWLTDLIDQRIAVEAFKQTREHFSAQAMQSILDGQEYLTDLLVTSGDQILEWIKNNLMMGTLLPSTPFHRSLNTNSGGES